ncbi:hypothetical protein PPSIR1_13130 [Plesiocystis pacifica SIR-1]|uniref:Uncharacterized protein n=1 Tax=Plesiocystis pacifica SIR-1 TaxID=391625 RepID=A6GAX3_9BACT|nr:hypothetical protein PPSIR1_13130 [Plesiocystis pacifica SIR-1]
MTTMRDSSAWTPTVTTPPVSLSDSNSGGEPSRCSSMSTRTRGSRRLSLARLSVAQATHRSSAAAPARSSTRGRHSPPASQTWSLASPPQVLGSRTKVCPPAPSPSPSPSLGNRMSLRRSRVRGPWPWETTHRCVGTSPTSGRRSTVTTP